MVGLKVVVEGLRVAEDRVLDVGQGRLSTANAEQRGTGISIDFVRSRGVQHPLEMSQSLLPRIRSQSSLSRDERVFDQSLRAEYLPGLGEVMSELRRMPGSFGGGPVELLQGLGDSGVEPYPPCERELVSQGLLDEGVGELVAPLGLRHLLDHPRCLRFLQNLQHAVLRKILDQRLKLP